MAAKVYNIAFELAAKLEGSYNTGMNRALEDLGELDRRARDLNSIRISGDVVRPLRDGLQELERNFREIRSNPVPNGMLGNMNTELREAVSTSRGLLQNLRQISTIRMPGNMFGDDMRRYLREVEQLERRMRDLQDAGGPAESPDTGAKGGILLGGAAVVGGGLLAAGAAAGVAGEAVYSFADEYQAAMAQIQSSTGASAAEMNDFSTIARNIYNQAIGEDFSDIAESMSRVEQVTQQSGAALEATTQNAIAFRDTFGEDVTESIKAADTMMKNFGVTSDQAYNLLAQGAQNGLNKSNELLDSANEYTPHFATLGFSAAEMFDTFGAGLNAGAFNLDKVGDAVKEFNIRSKDMSATSVEAYQALGMNAEKMSATFAAGGPAAQEAFRTVAQAISSIEDPVKKNAIGVGLFGTQFEDLEAGVIEAMGNARNQFDLTKDSMGEITKIKYDTIGKAFQGIGRQLQTGLLIPLSTAALPLLDKFGNWLQSDQAKIWGSEIVSAGQSVVGVFGHIWDTAVVAFHNIQQVIEENQPTFDQLRDVAQDMGDKLSAAFDGAYKVAEPFVTWMVNEGMPGSTQVVLDVVDAATGMYTFINDNWPAIEPIVYGLIGAFTAYKAITIGSTIATSAGTIAAAAWSAVAGVGATVTTAFGAAMAFLTSPIFLVAAAIGALIAIGVLLYKNWDTIKATMASWWAWTQATFSGIGAWFSEKFTAAYEGITSAFSGIGSFFSGLWGGVKETVIGSINWMIRKANSMIEGLNSISFELPFGGGTFGLSIPDIPEIGGYATGGYVTKPELAWVGEGGSNEWIIPEDGSRRSRDLWHSAGASMGMFPEKNDDDKAFDVNISDLYKFNSYPEGSYDLNSEIARFGEISGGEGIVPQHEGQLRWEKWRPTEASAGLFDLNYLNGYASGGYVTKPELAWVGEGRNNEWIIPENGSQRSRDLWQSAGATMEMFPDKDDDDRSFDINILDLYKFNSYAEGNYDLKPGIARLSEIYGGERIVPQHEGQLKREIWKPTESIAGLFDLYHLNGYANGGNVTQPEQAWMGEQRNDEWILPENNNQRYRDLWQSAGNSSGAQPDRGAGGDTYEFYYSPTIVIQGNADERVIQQAVTAGHDDFERRMSAFKAQQRRVSME